MDYVSSHCCHLHEDRSVLLIDQGMIRQQQSIVGQWRRNARNFWEDIRKIFLRVEIGNCAYQSRSNLISPSFSFKPLSTSLLLYHCIETTAHQPLFSSYRSFSTAAWRTATAWLLRPAESLSSHQHFSTNPLLLLAQSTILLLSRIRLHLVHD